MSILDQAILDLQAIMENDGEFGTPVTFARRDASQSVTVNCFTDKIMVDSEGTGLATGVTERSTVAVHENTLIAAGYTVRNSDGNVAMTGDLVTMTVLGGEKKYTIKFQIPDQKLGCLVFVLENYATS